MQKRKRKLFIVDFLEKHNKNLLFFFFLEKFKLKQIEIIVLSLLLSSLIHSYFFLSFFFILHFNYFVDFERITYLSRNIVNYVTFYLELSTINKQRG